MRDKSTVIARLPLLHDWLQRPWDHDSEDGLLTGSIIHRSTTGFDHSSLSRRSELPPEDDDTRDLGELILALKGKRQCFRV